MALGGIESLQRKAIIAEDEPLAVDRLRKLVDEIAWLSVAGVARTGPDAVAMVDELTPDVLFLDVQMPGANGLEVLERVTHRPHVIFTTAHDRYAVAAFDVQALDYLVKPFGERRFVQAAERVRRRIEAGEAPSLHPDGNGAYRSRLFVRERGRVVPVPVRSIERLEAHGDYVMIHTESKGHLVHVRMKDFEAMLDPRRFLRVHRSRMVNADAIVEIQNHDRHRVSVRLRSGATVLASRDTTKALRARFL